MVTTLCFHYRGQGFNPWLGKFVIARGTDKKNKRTKKPNYAVMVSSVQQSDSVSYICVCLYNKYIYRHTFFLDSSLGRDKLGILD